MILTAKQSNHTALLVTSKDLENDTFPQKSEPQSSLCAGHCVAGHWGQQGLRVQVWHPQPASNSSLQAFHISSSHPTHLLHGANANQSSPCTGTRNPTPHASSPHPQKTLVQRLLACRSQLDKPLASSRHAKDSARVHRRCL